ncbi:MAG: hypothetical protein AB7N71_06975 [Phycisphaerae bacterium]
MSTGTISEQAEIGTTFSFDAITTPGAYICDWSGHLLRVPTEAISKSGAPAMNVIGPSPLTVTKISEDPYIPLTQAKHLATQRKLAVKF